jgi:UDP-N-acetylmuramyl tripeptide synthase
VALFTNLSQSPDFHGNMAAHFAAKTLLFTAGYAKRGVVNGMTSTGAGWRGRHPAAGHVLGQR